MGPTLMLVLVPYGLPLPPPPLVPPPPPPLPPPPLEKEHVNLYPESQTFVGNCCVV